MHSTKVLLSTNSSTDYTDLYVCTPHYRIRRHLNKHSRLPRSVNRIHATRIHTSLRSKQTFVVMLWNSAMHKRSIKANTHSVGLMLLTLMHGKHLLFAITVAKRDTSNPIADFSNVSKTLNPMVEVTTPSQRADVLSFR